MKLINHNDLVPNLPIAYALHQKIFNDQGVVVDYQFLEVNHAFEELSGLKKTVLLGNSPFEILSDSDFFWNEMYQKVIKEFEIDTFETFNVSHRRYFSVIVYKLENHKVAIFLLDITNHILNHQRSEEIAEFYKTITRTTSDGVMIIDPKFNCKFVSVDSESMFGYNESELLQLNTSDLTHPDDLERLNVEFQNCMDNSAYRPIVEHRLQHKSGHWVWLESKFQNLIDNSYVNGIVVNYTVVTERINKEHKLKSSEALLNATLMHSRFSIWSIDLSYTLVYMNETFKQVFLETFGVNVEIGMRLIDFLPPHIKIKWIARYEKTIAEISLVERDLIAINNRNIVVEVSSTPIYLDGKVVGASFYGENISERQYFEDKLVESSLNLKMLLSASNQLVKPNNNEVNFTEITRVLCHIAKSKLVFFNRLYQDFMQIVSLSYLDDILKQNEFLLDSELLNLNLQRNEKFESLWLKNKFSYFDIQELVDLKIAPQVLLSILNENNANTVVVVRIDGNKKVVGNLIFALENGHILQNKDLIEMFTFQLGQYVERIITENELHKKMNEMERFNNLTVNRELNMIELKKEVNELLMKLGHNSKYKIVG